MILVLFNQIAAAQGIDSDRRTLDRLLAGIAAGERSALAELYHRTRGAVYGLSLSYLKEPEDAQDVMQDTFVRIWDNAPQYQSQGSPMAWILTIARNLSRMKLRERSKFTELDEAQWQAIPAESPRVTPEDRALLQTALSALGEEERRVVLLHAVTGLRHREIADLLELPLSTVLSKYHRALKKLKVQLKGENEP